ncbi:MAG: DEAD/DEAH box helicase [Alicyclobacillaceae bacterium]|nr:DEAD/DEAH box helicase [Alicyclobacillaceae bacterium]
MVEQRSPLVQIGGSWRLVPLDLIVQQIRMLEDAGSGGAAGLLPFSRALLMAQAEEDVPVEVVVADDADGAASSGADADGSDRPEGAFHPLGALRVLLGAGEVRLLPPPQGLRGTLRHYQQYGFSWLVHLRNAGFGACLADDMGLGKTIQVIACLLHLKETGRAEGPHLLLCPTSLLPNWRSEVARFAPSLRVYVHHGSSRETHAEAFAQAVRGYDVVLTTYATAVRDQELLGGIRWDTVVADEAQNIKNPDTKQSKAVCGLPSRHRIALTGTPVENRLEELWAIFHFTHPGYLGSLPWFRRTFANPVSAQPDSGAARVLQRLLAPVLLRRRKTEASIQIELPEKWETSQYAALTAEQAALYQAVVNRLFHGLSERAGDDASATAGASAAGRLGNGGARGGSSGSGPGGGEGYGAARGAAARAMSRRGQILSALVRLKQVCDHPCLLVGGRKDPERSGKLRLLLELLEEVRERGEAALVFTQFRDMGELICDVLEDRWGRRPPFLHGGLGAAQRGALVEAFQAGRDPSPVLVLSLKAGGVGLNLTRANHVFHYDRWWNPAVEDQATDRVFRIGQSRDVQVHKLVCAGTLEERIDQMIAAKRALSNAVVGASEQWVTELDDQALRELFALDPDEVWLDASAGDEAEAGGDPA